MVKIRHILGMNARNLSFIQAYNPKRLKVLVDNKLLTKEILEKANLATPKIYAVFHTRKDVENFDWKSLPNSFVIKPNMGFGGGGILVVFGRKKTGWTKQDGADISVEDMKLQILDILDGNYSFANVPDSAFIEQKIKTHRFFKRISWRGSPDIRVIIYNKIPVMAMLRLPTHESGGRANLHQGAVGVGIEIASGITTRAWWKGRIIRYFPGSKRKLNGLKIPEWNEILRLASDAQQATGLGFLGADVVLDRDKGPEILELNARPGLSIQVANLAPLKRRLERVEGLEIKDTDKAIRVAKELFGGEIERKIEEEVGRKVIGSLVEAEIVAKDKSRNPVIAKIDTGAWRTALCYSLAEKLGLAKKIIRISKVWSSFGEQERPIIDLTFYLEGKKISTEVFLADRSEMKRDMIIGRQDLKGFVINPTKIFKESKAKKGKK